MKSNWIIRAPRTDDVEVLKAFIARFEGLSETDAGVAAEVLIAQDLIEIFQSISDPTADRKAT